MALGSLRDLKYPSKSPQINTNFDFVIFFQTWRVSINLYKYNCKYYKK